MYRFLLSVVVLSAFVIAQPAALHGQTRRPAAAAATAPTSIVDINTASAKDFEELPGVGPKMAARIVEYRQKNGPFKKIEDLMNVRGLGEKSFLKLKPQLTVAPPKADATKADATKAPRDNQPGK